uniref:Uncharacterized protein n=1 Tax=Ditylenchus dipsaci TaxID=166011 RepID=A0A915D4T1_9BILA
MLFARNLELLRNGFSEERNSFTEPYNEPVRRSGRDRHNLLYNSLDENIMQTPLFQHILDEANNSRHHGKLYSTTTSPSRSQNASNNKQASQPASSAIRRPSALLARERLHHYDHSNNRQQEDDDDEGPDFESNRYSFRSRQSSMKEYHTNSNTNSVGNSGKKNRSNGHRIYDEVGSFSPTPKSVHSEDDEVPMDENKHGRSRKSLNKSINGKSISPKDMSISSVTDGRRLSSRVANQSMRTQLLRRSGGLALSTEYKSSGSDGYVASKKAMQPLERLAIEGGGEEEDQDFGLTMYERVKSQPRTRQCRQNYQVNSVEYIEEGETKPLLNRHNNQQQDYQPQVKRSRYSRERTSHRVVIDDGEDENSRETVDSNDGPPKNAVEAPNEEEEEDPDALGSTFQTTTSSNNPATANSAVQH